MIGTTSLPVTNAQPPTLSMAGSSRPRPVPLWRRREWHLWRANYLCNNPQSQRGAWVQVERSNTDACEANAPRRRLVLVPDIFAGGIQLRSWFCYESGMLLRVRVWDNFQPDLPPLLVRVLHVARTDTPGEWLLHCAFVADN